MKIAVHINDMDLFDKKWPDYLEKQGIDVIKVNLKHLDEFKKIKDCDGVMWHYMHSPLDKQVAPKILSAIEEVYHIPVWPNYRTRWHFDEKVAQYYLFEAMDVPRINTWVFWNKEEALKFVNNSAHYPLVYKTSVGAGSSNVIKVDDKDTARKMVIKMFDRGVYPYTMNEFKLMGNGLKKYLYKYNLLTPSYYQIQKEYIYFQEFIPNNQYDIRITVIGNRAFGFIRYNREGDFRASGSGVIDTNPDNVPLEAVKESFKISYNMQFQSMAYDYLLSCEGKPLINEMSYGYVDSAVHECPGYWDDKLIWHKGHMWPEEAQVQDFISQIRTCKY